MAEGGDVEVYRTSAPKDGSAGIEGGTSCKNVIDQDVMMAPRYDRPGDQCKGIFQVSLPRRPVEPGLIRCIDHPDE